MPDWAIWFIVGAALLAGELVITAAVLGPVGVAAFGAGVVAAFGASTEVQLVAFTVMTLLSLLVAAGGAWFYLRHAVKGAEKT